MTGRQDVAIFWDYENCRPPSGASGYDIVNNIRDVAHQFGSVKLFKAYMELPELATLRSLSLRSELQAAGVSLIDCPHMGKKDVADKMMIVDMMAYVIDHPSSATFVLISGDRDFAYVTAVLRLREYRVILITPSVPAPHPSLRSQASALFTWNQPAFSRSDLETPRNLRTTSASENLTDERGGRTHRNIPSSSTLSAEAQRLPPDVTQSAFKLAHEHSSGKLAAAKRSPRSMAEADLDLTPVPPSPSALRGSSFWTHLEDSVERNSDLALGGLGKRAMGSVRSESLISEALRDTPSKPSLLVGVDNRVDDSQMFEVVSELSTSVSATSFNTTQTSISEPTPRIEPKSGPSYFNAWAADVALATESSIPNPPPKPSSLVPPEFQVLIEHLGQLQSSGVSRPSRSTLGSLLCKEKASYANAGVSTFGAYINLAEQAGLVELGGTGNGAWISLSPELRGLVDHVKATQPPPPPADENLPSTSRQDSEAKKVPPIFELLVNVLQDFRDDGQFMPTRTVLAVALIAKDPQLYKKAGVNKFKQYIALAQIENVVNLGGDGEAAWVSLRDI